MADAGYFRGTSAEQDNRFSDKEKKLLKQMRFADSIATKVEMAKVHLESLKPWISRRISELLGMEDDVLQEFVFNQLEAEKFPDGRRIQINLTGFLNGKNARIFTGELWDMLISAQESPSGIPACLVTAKKEELRLRTEEQERLNETLKRTVSRFQDKLLNDSPPPYQKGDKSRSPTPSSKSRPSTKSDNNADKESRRKDDSQSQSRRQYRSRRSTSISPSPQDRQRSRSRDRDNRGKRDNNGSRYDRPMDRRDRNRRSRSRSRSPRYRRRSPNWSSRQQPERRDYAPSATDRDRASQRKPKSDSFESTDRHKQTPTRSISPLLRANVSGEDVAVQPEDVVKLPSLAGGETSPGRSSDSGSAKDVKRSSLQSADEGSSDQNKKSKKRSKKHKKHKKHKKAKKDEDEEYGVLAIGTAVEKAPSEDLEKALREKALESLKRAMEKGIQSN